MIWEAEIKRKKQIKYREFFASNRVKAELEAYKFVGWTGKVRKKNTHRDVIFGDCADILL